MGSLEAPGNIGFVSSFTMALTLPKVLMGYTVQ